jgi:hypothetical protein
MFYMKNRTEGSVYYEIRVKGQLDPGWEAWFEGFTVTPLAEGETRIAGWVQDQSALHGLLVRIRNLNLALLSVSKGEGGGGPEADHAS